MVDARGPPQRAENDMNFWKFCNENPLVALIVALALLGTVNEVAQTVLAHAGAR